MLGETNKVADATSRHSTLSQYMETASNGLHSHNDLLEMQCGFPDDLKDLDQSLNPFWNIKESLYDG